MTSTARRRHRAPAATALAMLLGLLAAMLQAPAAHADGAWTLSTEQRRAYLYYYAPLLLKQGDENGDKAGRDWITNFDFDSDANFSTNRANWRNVNQYVAAARAGSGAYANWRIRPTMYTSLMEYLENGSKTIVLLYHVYNAADKDGKQIHDWERVEIVIRGVTGTPGAAGESFGSSTLTHHKEHIIREAADAYNGNAQFMQTASGRHLMVWQADESDFDLPSVGPHGHELRYVTNPYASIGAAAETTSNAKVNISSSDDTFRVHYVFVPEAESAAVSTWRAQPLNYGNAATLYSGQDNGDSVPWVTTKRITYELQDLADIIATHWQGTNWSTHWLANTATDILLDTPITDESGQAVVSTGRQRFYTESRDAAADDLTDGRDGIASKSWLYGAYSAERSEDTPSDSDDFGGFDGDGVDSSGRSRGAVSGDLASHGQYWRQHDFFLHSGGVDTDKHHEVGAWLPPGWSDAANGGFDGRWTQLFDDRAGFESVSPLTLSVVQPANRCNTDFIVGARASGGLAPFTFTWSNADPQGDSGNYSSAWVTAGRTFTVTVTSADGQSRSANGTVSTHCGPGQQIP